MCSIKQTKNCTFSKYFMHKNLHSPSHFIIIYLYMMRLAWHFRSISFLWSNKHFWSLKINHLESKFDCYCIETISVYRIHHSNFITLCIETDYSRVRCMSTTNWFHNTFWFGFFIFFFIENHHQPGNDLSTTEVDIHEKKKFTDKFYQKKHKKLNHLKDKQWTTEVKRIDSIRLVCNKFGMEKDFYSANVFKL